MHALLTVLTKTNRACETTVRAGQDEELEDLSKLVTSTKHIGLAVGEELDLHARLLDDLDDDVDRTGSRWGLYYGAAVTHGLFPRNILTAMGLYS